MSSFVLGAGLALLFAGVCRVGGASVFSESHSAPHLAALACALPIGYATAWTIKRITKERGDAFQRRVAQLNAGAVLFDGLALTFIPTLYGLDSTGQSNLGSYLLFGVGCIQLSASLQYQMILKLGINKLE